MLPRLVVSSAVLRNKAQQADVGAALYYLKIPKNKCSFTDKLQKKRFPTRTQSAPCAKLALIF